MAKLKRLVLTLISASLLLSLLLVATAYAAPSADHSEYSSLTVNELFNLEDAGEITTEELIAELKLRKANKVGTTSDGALGRHLVDGDGNAKSTQQQCNPVHQPGNACLTNFFVNFQWRFVIRDVGLTVIFHHGKDSFMALDRAGLSVD